MRRRGFTLLELLIVAAIVGLLAAIAMAAVGQAKSVARLAACASQMRAVHTGLMQYSISNANRFPPFAFSDYTGNLPLSGHWGGVSQEKDPAAAARKAMNNINLWSLVHVGAIPRAALICPAAESAADADFSYFSHSDRFSTYCLRVPYSEDLFRGVEALKFRYGGLMSAFLVAPGGATLPVGNRMLRVPQARTDLRYASAAGGGEMVDMTSGAWLADGFWQREVREPAVQKAGLAGYPRQMDWWHGERFNVLYADGSVQAKGDDDGVVEESRGKSEHAEEAWRFFDRR